MPAVADAAAGAAPARSRPAAGGARSFDQIQADILRQIRAGEIDAALGMIRRLARRAPFEAGPHYLRGVALAKRGDNEEAVAAFATSLRLRPDHADSAIRAGRSLVALDRNQGAVDYFRKAIALAPDSHRAHRGLAFALNGMKRYGAAMWAFRRALRLHPDDVPTLIGATSCLVAARRPHHAIRLARRATEVEPRRVEAWLVLGDALQLGADQEEAERVFRHAVEIEPSHAEARNALGRLLGNTGRYDEAMACFRKALELRPGFVEATWNISLNALRAGDFALGWETYEVRWQRKEAAGHPTFKQPLWLGEESLEGKTILLHGEQGIGDTIQFLRYVPFVCAQAGRVLLGLQNRAEALHPCFRSTAEAVFNRHRLPRFQYHAPLGSLPHALRRTLPDIPAGVPYLVPEAERLAVWQERVEAACGPAGRRPRIGLAWSGDPSHPNDHNRSIRFRDMLSVVGGIDADLVVLQNPVREVDLEDVAASRVHNLATRSEDMHDALALTSLMDLVVSVDTSLAHVAGAAAKEVWTLVPFSPDWRWLLEREDSPWYPTMRLWRQPEPRDWASVFDRLRIELLSRFDRA